MDFSMPFGCMETLESAGHGVSVRPEEIRDLRSATLVCEETFVTENEAILKRLEEGLSEAGEIRGGAACPFTASLTLELEQGESRTIYLATDSCAAWLSDGVYYDATGFEDIAELRDLFALEQMTAGFADAYFGGNREHLESYLSRHFTEEPEVYYGDGEAVVLNRVKGLTKIREAEPGDGADPGDGTGSENAGVGELWMASVEFRESAQADSFLYLTIEAERTLEGWRVYFYGLEG